MNNAAETAFAALLAAWTEHDDLRHQHASIAELAESRARLDDARLIAFRSQR